ncbi:hypothetical protein ASH04_06200 [Rhodococcus sp. Leaf233]|nr:hypothetical protein ASH04_06200 [Rhodococcus sp. Leaf233]
MGIPAITAFCASSNEARPLTINIVPRSGTRSCSVAQPTTLSTALWRPTSSRRTSMSPSAVNSAAACKPPVVSKTFCAARRVSGSPASVSDVTTTSSSSGECLVRNRIASSDPLPQTPHDEVV